MQAPAVLLLALGSLGVQAAEVTPVQKVLEMLNEMKAKGVSEMEAEQKIFREYTEWVDDQTTSLGFEIKTANSDIEELTAFIDKADNDVAQLTAEIADLDQEIASLEANQKELTALRSTEREEFLAVQKDYGESLDALDRAIQVLESQPQSVAQAEGLLQKMSVSTPGMRRVLAAFLQQKAVAETSGGPAVAAYESQSGGIFDMLKGLKKKFKSELEGVETEEANKAHAYDLEMLHIGNTIEHSQSQSQEKSVTKAEIAAQSGNAKGKLAETKAQLEEDKKLLAEIEATYKVKTEAVNSNQKVRADELEALSKAIEIISDPTVAGSYSKHVKLAQVRSRGSLLQMRSVSRRVSAKELAMTYLKRRANALSSKVLAGLAAQIQASPFAKVIDMIEKLLVKLKEEAAAEAEHKGWCDEQLHANKLKRDEKTGEKEKLTAEIGALAGQIETMGETIERLIADQGALTTAMAEATEQRSKEKATNEETIKDATVAQEAVTKALAILQEFYASQSAFIQQVPELKAYKGSGAKGGVIGMLEVILSDFARLEAETTADEATAAKEYDSFMADSKADKEAKHEREVKLKLDKDQAEFEKGELHEDLENVEVELQRALEYFETLKPACLEVNVSYEERVARREEEIAALKEAYGILDGVSSG